MWSQPVRLALDEDHVGSDLTTGLLAPATARVVPGRFIAQGAFTVAGLPAVSEVFYQLGEGRIRIVEELADGARVREGDTLLSLEGPAGHLLSGERVALNFLQHLSGVATATAAAVDAVRGTSALVADTRKTTPGLRRLEKYAVRMGGGINHRSDLEEAVFLKDNHWELLGKSGGDLKAFLERVPPGKKIVVEVDNEEQFLQAVEAGAKHIMIDNQPPSVVRERVESVGAGVTIEASGGITLDNIREFALAGTHIISLGALTHSAAAAPIGFEITI